MSSFEENDVRRLESVWLTDELEWGVFMRYDGTDCLLCAALIYQHSSERPLMLQQTLAQGQVQLLGGEACCCGLWDSLEQTAPRMCSGHPSRHPLHTWLVCAQDTHLQALL